MRLKPAPVERLRHWLDQHKAQVETDPDDCGGGQRDGNPDDVRQQVSIVKEMGTAVQ